MSRKVFCSQSSVPISSYLDDHGQLQNRYTFNNQYQREFIWKDNMKQELIKSMLNGYPIGTIIQWNNPSNNKVEIIDGLQRLRSIEEFIQNKLFLNNQNIESIVPNYLDLIYSKDNINETKHLRSIIENKNRITKTYFKDLPEFLKEEINNYLLNIVEIFNSEIEGIMNYFESVQNSERLKSKEIIKAFPNSKIINFLKIFNLDELASFLNFDNKNQNLINILVQFNGLLNNMLYLGLPESKIIKYVQNESTINNGFSKKLNLLFNKIKNEEKIDATNKTSKGLLKLFFIILFYTDFIDQYPIKIIFNVLSNILVKNKYLFNNKNISSNKDHDESMFKELVLITRGIHTHNQLLLVVKQVYDEFESCIKKALEQK